MNWDYVRVKKTKRKIKINKQKGNKQTKIKKQKFKKNLSDYDLLFELKHDSSIVIKIFACK
jgi:hypothetical protein